MQLRPQQPIALIDDRTKHRLAIVQLLHLFRRHPFRAERPGQARLAPGFAGGQRGGDFAAPQLGADLDGLGVRADDQGGPVLEVAASHPGGETDVGQVRIRVRVQPLAITLRQLGQRRALLPDSGSR